MTIILFIAFFIIAKCTHDHSSSSLVIFSYLVEYKIKCGITGTCISMLCDVQIKLLAPIVVHYSSLEILCHHVQSAAAYLEYKDVPDLFPLL